MANILLINPPIFLNNFLFLQKGLYSGPPLGLVNIGTYLKSKGFNVKFLDFVPIMEKKKQKINFNSFNNYLNNNYLNYDLKKFLIFAKKIILNLDSEFIGFTIHNKDEMDVCLAISKYLKKFKNLNIIFGGFYITTCNINNYFKYDFIDYFIIGYGEITIEKLLNKTNIKKIPGIVYKNLTNNYIINEIKKIPCIEKNIVSNFDFLNLNNYFISVGYKKGIIMPYQLGRGCNGKCNFCSNVGFFKQLKKSIDYKSPQKVFDEINFLKKKYKSNFFIFCDDAINSNFFYLEKILDKLILNKTNIKWGGFSKPFINFRIATKLKKAGCKYLIFGCESGSSKLLKKMNKGIKIKEMENCLKNCWENNILNYTFFIVGYPGESFYDYLNTVKFIIKNSKYLYGIEPFFFKKHEGSLIYDKIKEKKNFHLILYFKLLFIKFIQLFFISSRNLFLLFKKNPIFLYKYLLLKFKKIQFSEIYFNYHRWRFSNKNDFK